MLPLLLAVAVQIGAQEVPPGCDGCTLRLALASDKAGYEVGEPITLSVQLTNAGRRPVIVEHTSDVTGRHDGYRFDVIDEAGHRVADPGAAAVSLLEAIGGHDSLYPGGRDDRQFLLNHHVAPLKPGRYVVKARFGSRFVGRGAAVESNTIAIVIVPTSPDRVRQRIVDLTSRMGDSPGVATLLGFTGDRAAIPAVIDLLYRKNDQLAARAMDALLYFDPATVRESLMDALRRRGPSDRMIWFLVVILNAPLADTQQFLLAALQSRDPDTRAAAVEGLRLSNRGNAPDLFAPLAAMLTDSAAKVRHRAASAVGRYADRRAFDALRSVVADSDPDVSAQATIAIGWIATAAAQGSGMRTEAIDLLREIAAGTRAGDSRQAKQWLAWVLVK
jgi:hypothetical protein